MSPVTEAHPHSGAVAPGSAARLDAVVLVPIKAFHLAKGRLEPVLVPAPAMVPRAARLRYALLRPLQSLFIHERKATLAIG